MRLTRFRSLYVLIALLSLALQLTAIDTLAKGQRRSSGKRASSKKKSTAKTSRRSRGKATATRSSRSSRRIAAARRAAERRRQAALRAALARDNALRASTRTAILSDDLRGEDPEVRQAIMSALDGHAGTVVAMDPQTGRIYSIVNQQAAVRSAYVPCSTIKLVVGLAGLHEKEIEPNGELELDGGDYRMDLTSALARSDNGYFQEVGEKLGFDRVVEYARHFGLGEPSGINLPAETPGVVPNPTMRRGVGIMSSHGYGFAISPVQLAVLASAIVNGGYLLQPQIVASEKDLVNFKPVVRRKLEIDDAARARVIEGMVAAASYGTGRSSATPGALVGGKTGTCSDQISRIGLWTSVNSVENPTLALAVVVRGSNERGNRAAAIAGEVYRQLAHRFNVPVTRPRRIEAGAAVSTR